VWNELSEHVWTSDIFSGKMKTELFARGTVVDDLLPSPCLGVIASLIYQFVSINYVTLNLLTLLLLSKRPLNTHNLLLAMIQTSVLRS